MSGSDGWAGYSWRHLGLPGLLRHLVATPGVVILGPRAKHRNATQGTVISQPGCMEPCISYTLNAILSLLWQHASEGTLQYQEGIPVPSEF